ncbi:hypothetical protein [Sandaracinus amylolyticus]|uniref:hypothetical protein n=1 Tax=Sandaracinus amylolyticus TaxID=927083 RepID=UPI0012ED526D|nr:hypothetical protein [Sandaracinus amylolyticus]
MSKRSSDWAWMTAPEGVTWPSRPRGADDRASSFVLFAVLGTLALGAASFACVMLWPPYHGCELGPAHVARRDAQRVQSAAVLFLSGAPDARCADIESLVESGLLDPELALDPWGTRYLVTCDGYEVHVRSAGRDTKAGTDDDVDGW